MLYVFYLIGYFSSFKCEVERKKFRKYKVKKVTLCLSFFICKMGGNNFALCMHCCDPSDSGLPGMGYELGLNIGIKIPREKYQGLQSQSARKTQKEGL
jgi:hypothetical protein